MFIRANVDVIEFNRIEALCTDACWHFFTRHEKKIAGRCWTLKLNCKLLQAQSFTSWLEKKIKLESNRV